MKELLEELITNVVYFMIGMLLIKLVWEYFPFKFFKNQLCFEKGDEDEDDNQDKEENKK